MRADPPGPIDEFAVGSDAIERLAPMGGNGAGAGDCWSAVDARVLGPMAYAADHVGAVLRGGAAALERLLRGLIESGIAMAMIGSSRPASGCGQHASHFLDLLAARGDRRHAPHRLQVGYATHFAMRLERFAFAGGVPVLRPPRVGATRSTPP